MPGLNFAFRVDPLGALLGNSVYTLGITVLYSIGYMSFEHNRRRFLFSCSLSVTMGIAFLQIYLRSTCFMV